MAIAQVGNWTSGQFNNTTGGTLTGRTSTAGNNVIITASSGDNTASTITHSQAGTVQTARNWERSTHDYITTRYIENIVGGASHTITITTPGGTWSSLNATEYSGLATSSSFDGGNVGTGTGATLTSASYTTTQADELLIGNANNDDGTDRAWTATGGYTLRGNIATAAQGSVSFLEDRIVSSIASYTSSATWPVSVNWISHVVAFKAAGAAAADASGPPSYAGLVDAGILVAPLTPPAQPLLAWYVDPTDSATTADVSVAGYLPVGVHPLATSSADRNLTGILPAGILPYGPVSHDASVAGIVHVGAPAYAPSSHDANLAGILYSGPLVLTSGGFDYITTGVLYATATPLATVSHTASVAGILEVGVHPAATITHAANVTGILEVGAVPYGPVNHDTSVAGILYSGAFAYTGPSFDQSTTGILFAGAFSPSTITTSRTVAGIVHVGPIQLSTVTASRNVAGILELGATPLAVVTRTTSTLGLVVVGVVPYATFGPVAPLSPVTDTVYLSRPWEAVLLERTGTVWLRTSSTVDTGKSTDTPWRRTHQGQVIE